LSLLNSASSRYLLLLIAREKRKSQREADVLKAAQTTPRFQAASTLLLASDALVGS
jgi:hypothetical protein